MKKVLSSLLMSVLFISSASAQTYHDKTFLALRPATANAARTLTTWHNQINEVPKGKLGASLSATVFYSGSTNGAALGSYFGSNKTSIVEGNPLVINDFMWVSSSAAKADLYPEDLLHDGSGNNGSLQPVPSTGGNSAGQGVGQTPFPANSDDSWLTSDKLAFRPEVQRLGIELAYNQRLDALLKGLSFRVTLPVEDVRTSMRAHTSEGTTAVTSSAQGNLLADASVQNYLAGRYVVTGQDPLKCAKIDNAGHRIRGVADVNAQVQYTVWEQNGHAIVLNVGALLPLSSGPTAEFRFEPQLGARGHWGLGAGLDSRFRLWHDEDRSLDLLALANYRYLLGGTEKRTPSHIKYAFYEYGIIGTIGSEKLQPAANVLTQDFNVTPGSQLDAVAQLTMALGPWTLDAGYNLYFQSAESSKRRNAWQDGLYGYAEYAYQVPRDGGFIADQIIKVLNPNASNPYTNIPLNYTQLTLNTQDIDWKSVNNPCQMTHTLFVGVGYSFNEMEMPIHCGVGTAVEFFSTNASVETWSAWGKMSINF